MREIFKGGRREPVAAQGWLGSTAGITDEGQLVALARFESKEAAGA